MTITVTSPSSNANSSIAGSANNAAADPAGGPNSAFAMLFADAQLSSAEGMLSTQTEAAIHLPNALAGQATHLTENAALLPLLATQGNPRLALSKPADDRLLSDPATVLEDLLSQIKGVTTESEATLLQGDIATNSPPVIGMQIDPALLGKMAVQRNNALESDMRGISDALSGKKGTGNLLAALTIDESHKRLGDESLKMMGTDKVTSSEFSQHISNALNGARRPESEALQPKPISAHVQDQQVWPKQLGDRVVWMTQQGQHTAEIHLNPAQLGPLQITLNLSHENATAVFVSQHAEVRQALQDALPQLREMLASSGINLGQANVSDQGPKEQQNTHQHTADLRTGRDPAILQDGVQTVLEPRVTPIHRDNGSIDLFA